MIKINLDKTVLYLTDIKEDINVVSLEKKKVLTYNYSKYKHIKEILEYIADSDVKNHIIYSENLDTLFSDFSNQFTSITAAGGLVLNEKNEILFIFRNGKWDLPKGKLESNETIEMSAIREVEEETGIKVVRLDSKIITTYHTYRQNHTDILKSNHWFLMHSHSNYDMKPQQEEGIESVIWAKPKEIEKLLKNSYGSIKDVLNSFLK